MTVEPGLCSVTLRTNSILEVTSIALAAGLTTIEWGGDIHVPPGDVRRSSDALRATREAGLTTNSYGSYYGATREWPDPSAIVETALALATNHIRVWSPLGLRPGAPDDARTAVVDHLSRICALAAPHEVNVSLEFHPGTLTETASATLKLLADVGAPNLFTYWQPDPTLAVAEQREEFGAVRDVVTSVHVFAWTPARARLPLADDESLWRDVLAQLANTRLPHPTVRRAALLEFVRDDDPEQLMADAATLRSWLSV